MSMDSIDDLEAAEDLIGQFLTASRALLNASCNLPPKERQALVDVVREGSWYCRPTCDMHGTPHFSTEDGHHDPDDETCGCPCHLEVPPFHVVQAARDAYLRTIRE